jgi:(1->4)-alpha-D-glucan 1-alpha-D-glucosylmutase
MGLVVDIVPNHAAASAAHNPFWRDVLARGPLSPHAAFFDIRWDSPDPELRGKVLLPILGEPRAACVQSGRLRVERNPEGACLRYFEHDLPLSPPTRIALAAAAAGRAGVPSLATWAGLQAGRPEAEALASLQALLFSDRRAAAAINAEAEALGADPARLERLLERQHYLPVFWREGSRRINYRRFFDVDQLVGLRVEDEAVFDSVHALPLAWVREGRVCGLRIDHPDGLRDPTAYLERLGRRAPGAWIVVEKILAPAETLNPRWPVAGTTGYDFLNRASGLFVDPRGEAALTRFYREFTGGTGDFEETARRKKRLILDTSLASETGRLVELLLEIGRQRARAAGLSAAGLQEALCELIAGLPVYRTYIQPESGRVAPGDHAVLAEAFAQARGRSTGAAPAAWDLIEDILLLRARGPAESEFVLRFQQLSGPATAKGVEDTAFYGFNRLIGLNEVGGDPGRFGHSADAFHGFCRHLQSAWPQSMRAVATHDTKRGEDARLRIALLSEIPEAWTQAVARWSRMNAGLKRGGLPEANSEYFLYQTLVGAWPIDADRLSATLRKAAREAKTHTSWTDPDPGYEAALTAFAGAVLTSPGFMQDFLEFHESLRAPAMAAGLALALIHATAPGVPDIYQGAELWNLSQVDPDNRRPVDFGRRQRLLAELEGMPCEAILARAAEGLSKMFVIRQALAVRRSHPRAFGPQGGYRPLAAEGAKAGHLVAFERGGHVVALAPRLVIGLQGAWADTAIRLPPGRWLEAMTGARVRGGVRRLEDLLGRFPVALLVREGENP